jgi:HSP20 family molecular chaperone IbpA
MAEKIEASMKNGILTIRLPKANNNKTKKIQVRGF